MKFPATDDTAPVMAMRQIKGQEGNGSHAGGMVASAGVLFHRDASRNGENSMSKEPSDIIHAALIHAAATLTAAKKDVMEKASPDEVKKHFKTFLHAIESGWREHEAADHHHS